MILMNDEAGAAKWPTPTYNFLCALYISNS